MDALLDFSRGPLFRLTFALMVLGLLRVLVLDLVGMVQDRGIEPEKRDP